MWETILSIVLKIAVPVIGYLMERNQVKKEMQISFLKFVKSLDSSVSVKLSKSYQEQLDELKKLP